MIKDPKRIVISRTDSIGDVILTLPLAGIIKERFPLATIIFLGNTYTKPVINCSEHIDEIWEWAELEKLDKEAQILWLKEQNVDTFLHVFPRKALAKLAKKAKIPNRIGTSHRFYHWFTCNYRPNFTRKNSNLHEAQLNVKLLEPLRIGDEFSLKELTEHLAFYRIPTLHPKFKSLLEGTQLNLILHCKSQGSAAEWGVEQFVELAKVVSREKNIRVFFTGTENESAFFRHLLPNVENIHDLSGQMSLDDLIGFIAQSDALVAASTGPLHLAGILNLHTIGLYSSIKPTHAARWKPLGNNVEIIEDKKSLTLTQPLAIELREVQRAIETIQKAFDYRKN